MPRTPKNLTAARAIARSVHERDATTTAITTLAITLARMVDDAAAGAMPAYVGAKVATTYADVLRMLSVLVGPRVDDDFTRFLAALTMPTAGGLDERGL